MPIERAATDYAERILLGLSQEFGDECRNGRGQLGAVQAGTGTDYANAAITYTDANGNAGGLAAWVLDFHSAYTADHRDITRCARGRCN